MSTLEVSDAIIAACLPTIVMAVAMRDPGPLDF
jgi:hypothetical protein